MAMFLKLRQYLRSLEDSKMVDLGVLYSKTSSPPRDEKIRMAASNVYQSFKPWTLIDLIMGNLYQQDVQFSAKTWKKLLHFYDEANFDHRSRQVQLEALFQMSKVSASEIFEQYGHTDRNRNRNELYEMLLVQPFLDGIRENRGYAVESAGVQLSQIIKQFLLQHRIVSAFQYCLNELFGDKQNQSTPMPVECDAKLLPQSTWIPDTIGKMNIFTVQKFTPIKGVVLSDGILVNLFGIVSEGENVQRHLADLHTLCCHETCHYLARMYADDLNFSTPTKDRNSNLKKRKEEAFIPGKALEMGRFIETTLFGGIQPDWSIAESEAAATEFIKRAALHAECPPPLIGPEEHQIVNLKEKMPSFSFAGELIHQIM